jgi:hypothetical protein
MQQWFALLRDGKRAGACRLSSGRDQHSGWARNSVEQRIVA